MNKLFIPIFLLASIVYFSSCDNNEYNQDVPDVSGVDIGDFTLKRFDKHVSDLDVNNLKASYLKLLNQSPQMTDLYFKRLLSFPFENQDSFYHYISGFLQADEIKVIQDEIDKAYPNLDKAESDLRKASLFYKYYFPSVKVPNFYTFLSEFGYQTIIFTDGDRDGIGIGLDMFLGDGFDYKSVDPTNPAFSAYLTRSYNEDHIAKKAFEMLVVDILGEPNGKRLIDQAIYNGKKLYILDQILPFASDTILLEFSQKQMDWVKGNEKEIWSYFLEHNLLYETNHLKINKYVNPSPHSPGMPLDAPGKTGNYLGWQIVKSYMARNKDMSLEMLIQEKDSQKILQMSKYKPKRR